MKSRNDYDIGCPLCWAPPTRRADDCEAPGPAGAQSVMMRLRRRSRFAVAAPSFQVAARADAVHVLERPERLAGLRRLDAERRRVVHDVLRLHEHELAAGVRHSDRSRQQHRARRSRSGTADAFLSAAQSVPLHDARARRTSATKELIWTLTANGKTEKAYASLKTDYQIDKQVISTEVGGDNGSLRDELRDQHSAGAQGRRRGAAQRESRPAARRSSRSPAIPTTCRRGDDGGLRPGMRSVAGRAPSERRLAQRPAGAGTPRPGQVAGGRGHAPAAASAEGPVSAAGRAQRSGSCACPGGSCIAGRRRRRHRSAPDQMKTWMDTRAYANSAVVTAAVIPDALPAGRRQWVAQATFQEPGTLCAPRVASDGSLFTVRQRYRHGQRDPLTRAVTHHSVWSVSGL